MNAWWASLDLTLQVFWIIAWASTLVLVVQLLLTLIGVSGDHDFDAGGAEGTEFSADHPDLEHHSSGLGLISIRTVIAFFVGFGWAGVVLRQSKVVLPVAVVLAFVVGVLFMLVVFYLMRSIFRLSESGNIEYANAVGQTGTVYITIPAGGEGRGQVQVVVQGRLREVAAVTEGAESLAPGTPIQVLKVLGNTTMVVSKMGAA